MNPSTPVLPLGAFALLRRTVLIVACLALAVTLTGDGILERTRQGDAPVSGPMPATVVVNAARVQRAGEPELPWSTVLDGVQRRVQTFSIPASQASMLIDPTGIWTGMSIPAIGVQPGRTVVMRVDDYSADRVLVATSPEPPPEPQRPPRILNPLDIERAIERAYPNPLRAQGIGGTVGVQFLVGVDGEVTKRRVGQISAHPALDRAALAVAEVYRFAPALHDGEAVAAWVNSPVSFRPR